MRLLRCGSTARLRLAEAIEVRRARRQLRSIPAARTVTVIPTIGRDRLVGAVRSALDQTVRDHHVVVVSDGRALPPLPYDARLTVIALRRRYGLPALPRNVGVRVSRSQYVAFLDDDNTWTRDHLESVLPALASGADLAYSGLEWVAEDGRQLGTQSVPFDRARLRDDAYVDTNTIVMTRSRLTRFRVIPRRLGDATFEDWELAWRSSRRGRVVHVPAVTVRVCVHEGSQFVPRVDLDLDLDLVAEAAAEEGAGTIAVIS
ncbi:MAG: hypothetical protein QOI55_2800 [Actinomycetota bacterium]|nr:hypothetical protein [Actinomycetota bacterium]